MRKPEKREERVLEVSEEVWTLKEPSQVRIMDTLTTWFYVSCIVSHRLIPVLCEFAHAQILQ